jgi:hypothetical protein
MMVYWIMGLFLFWATLEALWERRKRKQDRYWSVNDR